VVTSVAWRRVPYARVVQSDSGAKDNIFLGENVGKFKKTSSHERVFKFKCVYRDRALWICKYENIVSGNKEREIKYFKFNLEFNLMCNWQIYYTENTSLLQSTINVRKIPPSTSIHFATRVRRSHVIRLSLIVTILFRQQYPKCKRAIRLRHPPFLIQPHTQKSKVASWRITNQLDATCYFIVILVSSIFFGHYYAHHQELATMMLITTLVVSFLVCCTLEVRCS